MGSSPMAAPRARSTRASSSPSRRQPLGVAPAVGACRIAMRLTSPSYEPSDPFELVLNRGLGAGAFEASGQMMAVPEPETCALMALGLAFVARRRAVRRGGRHAGGCPETRCEAADHLAWPADRYRDRATSITPEQWEHRPWAEMLREHAVGLARLTAVSVPSEADASRLRRRAASLAVRRSRDP